MNRLYDEICDYKNLSPLALAFIGDSVFDLLVKEQLVCKANRPIKKLHKMSVDRVCCQTQSKYMEKLMESLTDEEIKIYKRGRNAYTHHTPKNATNAEYHSATGFEALIGYLYLKGDINRLREIFEILD